MNHVPMRGIDTLVPESSFLCGVERSKSQFCGVETKFRIRSFWILPNFGNLMQVRKTTKYLGQVFQAGVALFVGFDFLRHCFSQASKHSFDSIETPSLPTAFFEKALPIHSNLIKTLQKSTKIIQNEVKMEKKAEMLKKSPAVL